MDQEEQHEYTERKRPSLRALAADENGEPEIVFFELRRDEELGTMFGVYTSPDGEVQREHLRSYGPGENMVIAQVPHGELLRAVQRGMPTSVYLDG